MLCVTEADTHMNTFLSLLQASLKQGITYGLFFLVFCGAVLYSDGQKIIELQTLGPSARTIVVMLLIASAVITVIGLVSRAAELVKPKVIEFQESRKSAAELDAKRGIADAEAMANYRVLPQREKLFLALAMYKENQRFHVAFPTEELYGLKQKGIIHVPAGSRADDVFVIRDNIWELRDTLLEEMKGPVRMYLVEDRDHTRRARRGGWNSGLEF